MNKAEKFLEHHAKEQEMNDTDNGYIAGVYAGIYIGKHLLKVMLEDFPKYVCICNSTWGFEEYCYKIEKWKKKWFVDDE